MIDFTKYSDKELDVLSLIFHVALDDYSIESWGWPESDEAIAFLIEKEIHEELGRRDNATP